jgi:hypothetical protein
MSISCELLADAAVLPGTLKGPFLRFIPHAAQRRFESICKDNFLSLISLTVFLFSNDLRTDLPLSSFGFKSTIGFRLCAELLAGSFFIFLATIKMLLCWFDFAGKNSASSLSSFQ